MKNIRHRNFWQHFTHSKLGITGLIGVLLILCMALSAPVYSDMPKGYGSVDNIQLPPSREFPLGTDALGLNVLAQLLWGARTSIRVGMTAMLYTIFIGTPIGLLAGYYGGKLDHILMSLTDVFLVLPTLPLMIVMAAVLGSSVSNVALVIGVLSWPRVARVVRANTLEVAEMPYIEAARCVGVPARIIVGKHILLQIIPVLTVEMSLLMSYSILSESGMSFLGLGDTSVWSWGRVLQNAHVNGIFFQSWWCSFFPSLFILVFTLAFNCLSIGLGDSFSSNTYR